MKKIKISKQTHSLPSYRHIALAALALMLAAPLPASAVELATGLAAVEEGDDRLRPAALFHLASAGKFYSQALVYGRDFAHVEERSFLVTAGARTPIFGTKWLRAGVGIAVLNETTVIGATASEPNEEKESATNVGATFGLHAATTSRKYFLQGGWDSSLFLAGQAGILLATGRKQALSVTLGMRF